MYVKLIQPCRYFPNVLRGHGARSGRKHRVCVIPRCRGLHDSKKNDDGEMIPAREENYQQWLRDHQ